MSERTVTVAALEDLHFDARVRGSLVELLDRVNREADVLALAGDLTTHRQPAQITALIEELEALEIPCVTVLGNQRPRARRR